MIIKIFLFLLGITFGSFLNVLVYRWNHNVSPLSGRSFCPKCRYQLAWSDNIPLLSFLLLGGRCRYCHSPISWQYPLVEFAAGIMTVFVFWLYSQQIYNLQFTIYNLFLTYALLVIFVSDLRYQTIPNQVVYIAILISLLFLILQHPHNLVSNLLSGMGAVGFFLLLVIVTRYRGMGMGDVKLVGLIGLVLGFPNVFLVILLASLTGAFVGVILVLTGRKHFGDHIPFGPFLSAATWLMLIWGREIYSWYIKIAGL